MAKDSTKECKVASNPSWTLAEWERFIEELLLTNPPRSILKTDAGHNNVELILEPRR
jgi:hypothetical protein